MKKNIVISLLLAIGLVFSQITPPFLGGMRFDFLLSFMFIAIFLTRDLKSCILIGLLSGFFSAFASSFPGGQLPNILEKILVSLVTYGILKLSKEELSKFQILFISIFGTFLSGSLFLSFANLIVGLPASFSSLLIAVVLPATALNGIGTFFLYDLTLKAIKLSNFKIEDI